MNIQNCGCYFFSGRVLEKEMSGIQYKGSGLSYGYSNVVHRQDLICNCLKGQFFVRTRGKNSPIFSGMTFHMEKLCVVEITSLNGFATFANSTFLGVWFFFLIIDIHTKISLYFIFQVVYTLYSDYQFTGYMLQIKIFVKPCSLRKLFCVYKKKDRKFGYLAF